MSDDRKPHPFIPRLTAMLEARRVDRREFLRTSTLLGLSATAAYGVVSRVTGEDLLPAAHAAELPRGGTLRIAMPVSALDNPHTYSWYETDITRQVAEFLTRTGQDNITRPWLLDRWEVSDDLKTWTLHLRRDVKWHSGRPFVADDVVWNLQHVLDADVGSSMLGLMQGYMLEEYDTGKKDENGEPVMSTRLWDASAIEKLDDHTVRLNCKEAQLAVPEHLFHYPMHILDPEEGGRFGVGSNGTGPFELTELKVGEIARLKARQDYWGNGPYLDEFILVDLGEEPGTAFAALASNQIDGIRELDFSLLEQVEAMPELVAYSTATSQTAVARMRPETKPFDDPRVRKAMRLAIDPARVLEIAHRGKGLPASHDHVCQIHPEYADIGLAERDVAGAKALLAEAGHADGIDVEIACKADPAWEIQAVQAMQQQWAEAGIRVKINNMPATSYWDVWDKVPFGFTEWTHRPLAVMVLSLAYRTGAPWNESGYSNPEFDRLLTKAEGIADPEARSEVMAEIEALMREEGPIVQPLWRSVMSAHHKRVLGFRMHPTSYLFAEEYAVEG